VAGRRLRLLSGILIKYSVMYEFFTMFQRINEERYGSCFIQDEIMPTF
jgi:hypothetical protein